MIKLHTCIICLKNTQPLLLNAYCVTDLSCHLGLSVCKLPSLNCDNDGF